MEKMKYWCNSSPADNKDGNVWGVASPPAFFGVDSRKVSGCSSSAGTAGLLAHRSSSALGHDFELLPGGDTLESSSDDDTFESPSGDNICVRLKRNKILKGREKTLKRRKIGVELLKICQEAFPGLKEDKLPKLLQSHFREHKLNRKKLLSEASPESSLCDAFKMREKKINDQITKNGERFRKGKEEIKKGYEGLEADDKNMRSLVTELMESPKNQSSDYTCAINKPTGYQHETSKESESVVKLAEQIN